MPKQAREIPRVRIISRHRADCSHKADGKAYVRCTCPKSLYWYEGGKEKVISADTEDYQVAERKAHEKQAGFERVAAGEPEYTTIESAVDLYLKSKRASGYTQKSIDKLELIFRDRFQAFFAQRGIVYLKDVKGADLEAWRASWIGAASTKGKVQGRVRGFFDWAIRRELIEKDPSIGLEGIKGAREVAPTLAITDEQFSAVLDSIDGLTHRDEDDVDRLRALALLQRWSGLAIRDALTIKRSAFSRQSSGWYRLFLRRAKTGVNVYVSLAPEVAAEILAVTPASDIYLFWNGREKVEGMIARYTNAYRRVSALAELKDENGQPLDFHSHMLRDTFAVWCFNQGMATEDVAALLGHGNITVTQQHYSPWINLRQERLGAIVEAAFTSWKAETEKKEAEAEAERSSLEMTRRYANLVPADHERVSLISLR